MVKAFLVDGRINRNSRSPSPVRASFARTTTVQACFASERQRPAARPTRPVSMPRHTCRSPFLSRQPCEFFHEFAAWFPSSVVYVSFRHEIVFETDAVCICDVVAWTCEPANERVQRRKEGSRSHVDVVPKGNCWFVAVEREMRRQKMAD